MPQKTDFDSALKGDAIKKKTKKQGQEPEVGLFISWEMRRIADKENISSFQFFASSKCK